MSSRGRDPRPRVPRTVPGTSRAAGPSVGGVPSVGVVVVAGGASRRFGADKLAADLDGAPVLARTLAGVAAALPHARLVVVGPPERASAPVLAAAGVPGRRVAQVQEHPPRSGPAAAVVTGAQRLRQDGVLDLVAVVPGDAPFAGAALPRLVAAASGPGTDAAVAVSPDGSRQYLLLVVHADVLPAPATEGAPGGVELVDAPARALLRGLRVAEVPVDDLAALDVDDPPSLERARAVLRGG